MEISKKALNNVLINVKNMFMKIDDIFLELLELYYENKRKVGFEK